MERSLAADENGIELTFSGPLGPAYGFAPEAYGFCAETPDAPGGGGKS